MPFLGPPGGRGASGSPGGGREPKAWHELEIYKPGQGKVARGAAYFLGMLLVIFGGISLYATINVPFDSRAVPVSTWARSSTPSTSRTCRCSGTSPSTGSSRSWPSSSGRSSLHLILNRPTTVDTLIDTEQELKKVSWPSRREVWNATLVVVLVTFTMAIMLYGFDWLLRALFQLVI